MLVIAGINDRSAKLNVQTNNDRDGRQLDPARRRPRTIDDPAAFERVGLDRALEAGWLECVDVKRDLRHFSTTLSSITTANTSQGGAQGPQRDKTSRAARFWYSYIPRLLYR